MGDGDLLKEIVLILSIAVVVVTLFHRIKIPSIAGFIMSGILVGPMGLGLINSTEKVEQLAEIGVALLLFGIGLELPINRLKKLWKPILAGGTLQVLLSIFAVMGISIWLGFELSTALLFGFIIAISSTAIVLGGLEQRGEVDAPHGQLTLGILVFQDLCVVPMMLAIPLMASKESSPMILAEMLFSAALIVSGVLIAARLIVPRVLRIIARTRQRHLFVMTVLLVCIGTAWITSRFGLSLALGAFLAGLVVAGSEYRHQALADLISFREVFTSLFFISVGMLLDPRLLYDNMGLIFMILAAVLFGKFMIVFITGSLMKLPLRVTVLAAVALSQVGEFSFILTKTAEENNLIDPAMAGNLVAVAILSMLITPFALSIAPTVAAGVGKLKPLTRFLKVSTAEETVESMDEMKDHVIIGGYGFAGEQLARSLKEKDIPYIIVELNIDNIKRSSEKGEIACFGDITSPEVLEKLGAKRAKELVLVINDPTAVERSVKAARSIAPDLHIIVRTRYLLDVPPLMKAGADEVIPAELEAAGAVIISILHRHNIDEKIINEEVAIIHTKSEEY